MKIRYLMLFTFLSGSFFLSTAQTADQPVLVNIKRMSLETALKIGQAAIADCRKKGIQAAVTVVDRGGNPQVVMRDVLASDVTLEISRMKAYTAMAFNSATSALEGRFKTPFSPGKVQTLMLYPGGVPVHAGGSIVGGVGVSGAPSGNTDEECAKAGVDAVSGELEFAE